MKTTAAAAPVLGLENVTIRDRRRIVCHDITLSVPSGSAYVLLGGPGSGKTSLVGCLLGEEKPAEGAAFLFGQPSRKLSREALSEVGIVSEELDARPRQSARDLAEARRKRAPRWDSEAFEARLARFGIPAETPFRELTPLRKRQLALALAMGPAPRLLVIDEPSTGIEPKGRSAIWSEIASESAGREMTVFAATADAAGLEEVATHVGILKDGRLAVNEPLEDLKARFRRLLYTNEMTSERTEYGNELDEFDAVRVRVRGWGIEAVVSNFTPEAFARLTAIPGLSEARAEAMSLEEITLAITGEKDRRSGTPPSPA
jgi:ABC-2 type transport system ATP-binding protein